MTPEERCPVCYADDWGVDYMRTDDGEMPVPQCEMCGWPPPSPHSVLEYREKWLSLGDTPWSHPGPAKFRHIGVLVGLLDHHRVVERIRQIPPRP